MKTIEIPNLKFGDYCHGHRWADKDPCDPYAVGYLCGIRRFGNNIYFLLEGDNVPERWWPHCEKATIEEGRKLLSRICESRSDDEYGDKVDDTPPQEQD